MKNICFPFCNASPKKKSESSPCKRRKYSPHPPQPTLPHKGVTLRRFRSDFKINANDAKPDKDNADANEAIEVKADKTVQAN